MLVTVVQSVGQDPPELAAATSGSGSRVPPRSSTGGSLLVATDAADGDEQSRAETDAHFDAGSDDRSLPPNAWQLDPQLPPLATGPVRVTYPVVWARKATRFATQETFRI